MGTDFYGAEVVSIHLFEIVCYFKVAEQARLQGYHVLFRKKKNKIVQFGLARETQIVPSVFGTVSSVLCTTLAKFQLAGFCRVMDCLDND